MKKYLVVMLLIAASLPGFSHDSLVVKSYERAGLSVGTWFPAGANKAMGSPLILGIQGAFRFGKNTLSIYGDVAGIGIRARETIQLLTDSAIYSTTEFLADQFLICYGRDIFKPGRLTVIAEIGGGYGNILYHKINKEKRMETSTLLLSPGVTIKYHFDKFFIKLRTDYCFANTVYLPYRN